jgi:hypothetical protein
MRGGSWLVSMWGSAALACGASDSPVGSSGSEPPGPNAMASSQTKEGEDELASGRAAGAAAASPALNAGRYVLGFGEIELMVDPSIGGRITRFSLSGENILTGPDVVAGGPGSDPNMYGSTFWTSPQSAWGWPPEVAIDAAPHQAEIVDGVLQLASEAGSATGYAVRKRFWTEAERDLIAIEYTLENQSATLPAAPWEISRVPKEGFVFFAASAPALPQSNLPSTFRDGVAWVDVTLAPPADSKLFQDGSEGWLAYVYRDLVFIKTFVDTTADDVAPSEAEIEVFVSGLYEYAEIEQQGRYAMPPDGADTSWRVNWMLKRLPPTLDASFGSPALVEWVRAVAAASR